MNKSINGVTRNYRRRVTSDNARRWWFLVPEKFFRSEWLSLVEISSASRVTTYLERGVPRLESVSKHPILGHRGTVR